ncbi:MAG: endolytic transglycosylase MltG [Acidobacteria bacterium]|nr:endolytic transglycosylase MltG [Acidobacteriota bacterium]
MRRLVRAGVAAVAIAVLAAGWSLWRPGPDREITIDVPEGASGGAVLARLHRAHLVPVPLTARIYLVLAADGRSLHYGTYRFAPRTRPVEAIGALLEGRVAMVSVTIVEGSTLAEIAERMTAAGIGTAETWSEAGHRVAWVAGVAPGAPSLEGFLFPDTYRFAVGTRAITAAHVMAEHFLRVWRAEAARVGPLWGSPLAVVTLASLVEAETPVPEERPVIAGVFLNRLRRGMLLQCDPTVVYALKRHGAWRGRLQHADLAFDDPYNTYRYPGLPPGPIDCPGRGALRAALAPARTRFLYFVAKPGGGHEFSVTLREHNRAVARLRRYR